MLKPTHFAVRVSHIASTSRHVKKIQSYHYNPAIRQLHFILFEEGSSGFTICTPDYSKLYSITIIL
jgi:hypothetical protein